MKTSLTIIPMCPRERFPSYKNLSRLVLCYKKDCATLLYRSYFFTTIVTYLLQIILLSNYYATYNFSTCRHYLAENHLSFPSAPRWVRHFYLSKRLQLTPYTCGSSRLFSGAFSGKRSALCKWKLVRKHYYYVLKFIVTCYYGK